jgi:hypothetical protein
MTILFAPFRRKTTMNGHKYVRMSGGFAQAGAARAFIQALSIPSDMLFKLL